MSAALPAQINSQRLMTDFSQYAGSYSLRAYCYAELAVSSPAVAEPPPSTQCIYPLGMASLSGLENTGIVWKVVTNPSSLLTGFDVSYLMPDFQHSVSVAVTVAVTVTVAEP